MKKAIKVFAVVFALILAVSILGCQKKEKEEAGTKTFKVEVYDLEGTKTTFEYKSNAQNVGEALQAAGLISGEDSQYGLMVTTVNGLTVKWEDDGKYWAFYINGEYANTGVDSTPIEEGAVYTFKVE